MKFARNIRILTALAASAGLSLAAGLSPAPIDIMIVKVYQGASPSTMELRSTSKQALHSPGQDIPSAANLANFTAEIPYVYAATRNSCDEPVATVKRILHTGAFMIAIPNHAIARAIDFEASVTELETMRAVSVPTGCGSETLNIQVPTTHTHTAKVTAVSLKKGSPTILDSFDIVGANSARTYYIFEASIE